MDPPTNLLFTAPSTSLRPSESFGSGQNFMMQPGNYSSNFFYGMNPAMNGGLPNQRQQYEQMLLLSAYQAQQQQMYLAQLQQQQQAAAMMSASGAPLARHPSQMNQNYGAMTTQPIRKNPARPPNVSTVITKRKKYDRDTDEEWRSPGTKRITPVREKKMRTCKLDRDEETTAAIILFTMKDCERPKQPSDDEVDEFIEFLQSFVQDMVSAAPPRGEDRGQQQVHPLLQQQQAQQQAQQQQQLLNQKYFVTQQEALAEQQKRQNEIRQYEELRKQLQAHQQREVDRLARAQQEQMQLQLRLLREQELQARQTREMEELARRQREEIETRRTQQPTATAPPIETPGRFSPVMISSDANGLIVIGEAPQERQTDSNPDTGAGESSRKSVSINSLLS